MTLGTLPGAALLVGWVLLAHGLVEAQESPGLAPGGQSPGGLWVTGRSVTATGGVYAATSGVAPGVEAGVGAVVNLTNAQVSAVGGSKDDFVPAVEGATSGVLAFAGAKVSLMGGAVRTSGVDSNALYATGVGTSLVVSDAAIGTEGPRSPAVRSVSGASVQVVRVTAKTTEPQSPAIQASGSVQASRSVLVALAAPAVVIEGSAGVVLDGTEVVGRVGGVVFRQGPAALTVAGGSVTAIHGALFEVDGPGSVIHLKEAILVASEGVLVQLNSAGGGTTLNADHQLLTGAVTGVPGASLAMNLRNGSQWTGTVPTGSGPTVDVVLDATSTWVVTADSTVNSLSVAGNDVAQVARGIVSEHRIGYKASANGWLHGQTVGLSGGGSLVPF